MFDVIRGYFVGRVCNRVRGESGGAYQLRGVTRSLGTQGFHLLCLDLFGSDRILFFLFFYDVAKVTRYNSRLYFFRRLIGNV